MRWTSSQQNGIRYSGDNDSFSRRQCDGTIEDSRHIAAFLGLF
jgi:hypothetical protein